MPRRSPQVLLDPLEIRVERRALRGLPRRRAARAAGAPAPRSGGRTVPGRSRCRGRAPGRRPAGRRARGRGPPSAGRRRSPPGRRDGGRAAGACSRPWSRALPTRSATCSWVSPNSSISWRYASASSIGSRSARCTFSTSATSSCVAIGELADERGDPFEAGEAGRAHASLAGDELVAVERLRDEDGLEHAVLPDARRELLEHGVVDAVAGLVRVGRDPRQRHLDDRCPTRPAAAGSATTSPRPSAGALRSAFTSCADPRELGAGRSSDGSLTPGAGSGRSADRATAARGTARRPRTSRASARYASAPFDSGR